MASTSVSYVARVNGLVLLEHALDVVGGRDADADPVAADRLGDGPGHLDREAGVGLGGAAVRVGAGVGGLAQELVDQVAVGGVHLDAVEARRRPRCGRR